jgi:hypothetical protein
MKALKATLITCGILAYAVVGAWVCTKYVLPYVFDDPAFHSIILGFIAFVLIHFMIEGVVLLWGSIYDSIGRKG